MFATAESRTSTVSWCATSLAFTTFSIFVTDRATPASVVFFLPPPFCLLVSPSVLLSAFPASSRHQTQSNWDQRCLVDVGGVEAPSIGRHPPMQVPLVCVGGFSSELQCACKSKREMVNNGIQCGCYPASTTVSVFFPNTRTSASACRHALAPTIYLVLSIILRASCCLIRLSTVSYTETSSGHCHPVEGIGGREGSSTRTVTVRLVVSSVRRPLKKNSSQVGLMSRFEEYLDTLRGCGRTVVDVGVRDPSARPYPYLSMLSSQSLFLCFCLFRVICSGSRVSHPVHYGSRRVHGRAKHLSISLLEATGARCQPRSFTVESHKCFCMLQQFLVFK